MMLVKYAGGEMLTGERIAEALVRYAAALAQAETAEHLDVPGRTADGADGRFKILLGPASQILVEPTDDSDDIVDAEFVAALDHEIDRLSRPAQALPIEEAPSSTAFDDL